MNSLVEAVKFAGKIGTGQCNVKAYTANLRITFTMIRLSPRISSLTSFHFDQCVEGWHKVTLHPHAA
jgi:hypothetical protein